MSPYPTTAIDPATVPLSRLRSGLLAGQGPAALDPLSAALRSAAGTARDTADDLDGTLRRDDAVHAGAAADAARTHLAAVARDAHADAGRLERAAVAVEEMAAHHGTARRDVGPGPAAFEPGRASPSAMLAAALDDTGGEQQARHAVAVYQSACNDVLTRGMPMFA